MRKGTLIVIIAFSLLKSILYGQTQVLKNYKFEKGGYYLLGTRSFGDDNGLADSLGEFYTDDINILNAIKKEWTFKNPSPQYACGYHYNIYICKDGINLESLYINLNCNELACDKGYFFFETEQLRMFKDKFKKPISEVKRFDSINVARKFRENVLKGKSLIYTSTDDWIKYEGNFKFTYICTEKKTYSIRNEKKIIQNLTLEIEKAYPGEQFELENRGGSSTEVFVEVKCNKSLNDKFQLYKRNLKYDGWEPYIYLILKSYWARKNK